MAFRSSGTLQTIALDARIAEIVMLNAQGWNIGERREPTFSYLLLSTCLVEGNNMVLLGRLKIRGRVIKCQVTILTYADQSEIDRGGTMLGLPPR